MRKSNVSPGVCRKQRANFVLRLRRHLRRTFYILIATSSLAGCCLYIDRSRCIRKGIRPSYKSPYYRWYLSMRSDPVSHFYTGPDRRRQTPSSFIVLCILL